MHGLLRSEVLVPITHRATSHPVITTGKPGGRQPHNQIHAFRGHFESNDPKWLSENSIDFRGVTGGAACPDADVSQWSRTAGFR
jgi:hypothetical protein